MTRICADLKHKDKRDALKVRKAPYYHPLDEVNASLGYCTKTLRWSVRYKPLGDKTRFSTIGRQPSYKKAAQVATELVRSGALDVQRRRKLDRTATIGDAITFMLWNERELGVRSERSLTQLSRKLSYSMKLPKIITSHRNGKEIKESLLEIRVDALTQKHLLQVRDLILERLVARKKAKRQVDSLNQEDFRGAKNTCNQYLASLLSSLNYFQTHKRTDNDGFEWKNFPFFSGVKATRKHRSLEPKELDKLFLVASEKRPYLVDALTLLLRTGCRPKELTQCRLRDFDADTGLLTLRHSKGADAREKTRQVPLVGLGVADLVRNMIREYQLQAGGNLDLDAPLFVDPEGGAWRPNNFCYHIKRAFMDAGLHDCSAYSLRVSSASQGLSKGMKKDRLAQLMGTSAEILDKHYDRPAVTELNEAVAPLGHGPLTSHSVH